LGQQDKTLNRYLKPDLLIVDDMGMKQLPRRSGECLLEIIMRRHENRSTVMTSNRPLEDWAKLIGDVPAATAILDRFLQHATIINITGKSYRLRHGGNVEAKANSKGRRNTADDGACSPPEDIYEQAVVKGRTGVKRDLFKHLFGVIAPDAPFHIIRCRPHSPLRPEIGQVFRTRSDS
jgi:hypothetical protein